MQYLQENKGAFKLILDYSRLRIQALLYFVHLIGRESEEAKVTLKQIIMELIEIVKVNFENVKEEFYSILDMNELLISLVAWWVQENKTVTDDLTQNADKFLYFLNETEGKMTAEQAFDFSDIDADKMDENFLGRLYGSYCVKANYGKPPP